jgi:outer membrane protein OmpA-like peptidoglycan-associated protein/uncharacterized membrane protein YeaQ/YmgE (transglycosylase-associated protein family)
VDWVISIALLAILGLIVGAIAKFIMPGDDPGGIVATSILGLLGAVVGAWVGNALGIGGISGFDWRSLVTAVAGALLLLLAYRAYRMLTPGGAGSAYAGARSTSAPLRAYGQTDEYETSSAPNLAAIAKQSITSDMLNRLSEQVGESPGAVRKALEAMIPTVLASFTSHAATSAGANRLFDLVKGAMRGGIDRNLSEGNLEAMGRHSHDLLSMLFGDKLAGLLNWLARFAGIKDSSASALTNAASSLVMSALGRTIQQQGLEPSQFASLLSSQSRWLSRLLPSGITDIPGMRALAEFGDRAAEATHAAAAAGRHFAGAAERAVRGAVRQESPLLSALLPLALLLLAIPLLGWLLRGAADKVQQAADATIPARPAQALVAEAPRPRVPEPDRAEMAAAPTPIPTTINMTEIRLPSGATLKVPETSFLNAIYKWVTDATAESGRAFAFDGLEFEGANIRLASETGTTIANLSKLLAAFPSVTLRIEGHTDPSGDAAADQKQSLARADALKILLVKAGVPGDRITTAGLGSERPVASNDTAEGRAKNRRIELSLLKSS